MQSKFLTFSIQPISLGSLTTQIILLLRFLQIEQTVSVVKLPHSSHSLIFSFASRIVEANFFAFSSSPFKIFVFSEHSNYKVFFLSFLLFS